MAVPAAKACIGSVSVSPKYFPGMESSRSNRLPSVQVLGHKLWWFRRARAELAGVVPGIFFLGPATGTTMRSVRWRTNPVFSKLPGNVILRADPDGHWSGPSHQGPCAAGSGRRPSDRRGGIGASGARRVAGAASRSAGGRGEGLRAVFGDGSFDFRISLSLWSARSTASGESVPISLRTREREPLIRATPSKPRGLSRHPRERGDPDFRRRSRPASAGMTAREISGSIDIG